MTDPVSGVGEVEMALAARAVFDLVQKRLEDAWNAGRESAGAPPDEHGKVDVTRHKDCDVDECGIAWLINRGFREALSEPVHPEPPEPRG